MAVLETLAFVFGLMAVVAGYTAATDQEAELDAEICLVCFEVQAGQRLNLSVDEVVIDGDI